MSITPSKALQIALTPTPILLLDIFNKHVKNFDEENNDASLQTLEKESLKEELKAKIMQNQAKVAQELAIAKRIEDSDEVDIEEYYDISGEGNVGAKSCGESITLGINAEGRKVTKRVIKFRGGHANNK